MIGSYGHAGYVLNSSAIGKNVELVAVARFGPDDQLRFVKTHKSIPRGLIVYDDYRKMLDEVCPDIVSVCMPLYRNAEASTAAAEHACHIFSEKPLATTFEDLDKLKESVNRNNVRIAAMLAMRGEPRFQAVKKTVSAGHIGEPILAFGQKSYPFGHRDNYYKQRETYGGSILWQAIHAIDFVSYCTGKDYARVCAMQSNMAHPTYPGMEDNGGIILEFAGGGTAIISFDYLRPRSDGVKRTWGDGRLRVVGSDGIVEIFSNPTRVVLTIPANETEVALPPERDVFAEFLASIRGEGASLVTAEESFRITEVALKAREAADTRQVLYLR